mmetsp:Transcript_36266/g.71276  ORF Transcript_36266/g.71276 Transcript_36266/m.71276 type:complete len:143 (-) Transcript_36266:97-525(-)
MRFFLFAILAVFAAQVVSADNVEVPDGQYCGTKGILTFTSYVKFMISKGTFDFRVDGAMHVANCYANRFTTDAEGKFEIVPRPCMTRLCNQKTKGEMPAISYDAETKKITIQVNGVPVVKSFNIELSKDGCEEIKPHSKVEL